MTARTALREFRWKEWRAFKTGAPFYNAWTDNDNAGTSAEAQAFKRTCACLGLGRYFYDFDGGVDLDERKRPKTALKLFGWATPEGWRQGLRPEQGGAGSTNSGSISGNPDRSEKQQTGQADLVGLVREIEALEKPLGKGLYRGLLKTVILAKLGPAAREIT